VHLRKYPSEFTSNYLNFLKTLHYFKTLLHSNTLLNKIDKYLASIILLLKNIYTFFTKIKHMIKTHNIRKLLLACKISLFLDKTLSKPSFLTSSIITLNKLYDPPHTQHYFFKYINTEITQNSFFNHPSS
jgi:lantibiotic modifying enzyme